MRTVTIATLEELYSVGMSDYVKGEIGEEMFDIVDAHVKGKEVNSFFRSVADGLLKREVEVPTSLLDVRPIILSRQESIYNNTML